MRAVKEAELWLASAWALVAPVHPTIAMVILLPIADLSLACIAAWKTKKELPHSYGIGRTIGKIVLYVAATLLAYATQQWLLVGSELHPLTWVTTVIGLRELKSCLEHLDDVYGGDLLRSAIDRLVPKSSSSDDDKEKP